MEKTITMSTKEQRRAWVLTKLLKGERTIAEAATALQLSERQIGRLRASFERDGPAGLVHGNRGRASPRRLADQLRQTVIELARDQYRGINDCHLADLLVEREGLSISRQSLQRILRQAGLPAKRSRRRPRHRSRRERMAAEGSLLQIDGSRHRWLEERGPQLTLLAAIDDATGKVVAATFREQEDAAGYFELLRAIVTRHGLPGALYRDRHGIFEAPAERADDGRDAGLPSQFGRALVELGIRSIAAHSPQAKGRIERLWGTLQDRLVAELRLAGIDDRTAANAFLPAFMARHNERFAVSAAQAEADWLPVPGHVKLDQVLVLKYRRKVAKDHTVRLDGRVLQLPRARYAYSGKTVEIHLRLDGTLVAFDGRRQLAVTLAPAEPRQLRALRKVARTAPALEPAPARLPWQPAPDHPWKRRALPVRLGQPGLTDSLSS
jgi:transposase